jgi:hypothetical protein
MSPASFGAPAAALWDYWMRCRGTDLVPRREAFNPMAIAAHLPIVSLIERMAPMHWHIRLVGTAIAHRSGELTGRNYIDLLVAEHRAEADRRLTAMLEHPCGTFSTRRNIRSGLDYVVRVLALPLRAADGERRLVITTNEELPAAHGLLRAGIDALELTGSQFLDIGAGVPDM